VDYKGDYWRIHSQIVKHCGGAFSPLLLSKNKKKYSRNPPSPQLFSDSLKYCDLTDSGIMVQYDCNDILDEGENDETLYTGN